MAFSGVIPLMRALDGGARTAARLADLSALSPSEVGARLAELRDIFGAAENRGGEWRLTFRPQWLDKTYLAAALPGCAVHIADETPGTNELARTAQTGDVFFAEHQTRGRGRRDRRWLAMPGGNIAATARLPAPSSPAGFPLAVGAALWRALGGAAGGLKLKWPNDLQNADGEKIGGVLIDLADGGVAVGAGINLAMTPRLRKYLGRPAAALNPPPPRNECAALVCKTICRAAAEFARDGLAAFLPDARAAHILRDGEEMRFRCGGEEVRGRFAGFGGDGALLIQRQGGVREYVSGEIANVAGG
ncbi:MAG: biotin--[acetyl-CoA-carboxylase] ligase [Gammaproteobacteria bacterium]